MPPNRIFTACIISSALLFVTNAYDIGGGGNSVVGTSAEEGEDDPPPQTPLPMDISGQWRMTRNENCHGYKAAKLVFTGEVPDLDSFLGNRSLKRKVDRLCRAEERNRVGKAELWIFQDCLESTTTEGGTVHHMISDGASLWVDWMYGVPVEWESTIEPPLPEEALDGATATMTVYTVDPVTKERFHPNPEDASVRRYVNSDGELVVSRDAMKYFASNATTTAFPISTRGKWIWELVSGPLSGCTTGHDPDLCADRVYTDETLNWTVACCENSPGGDDFFDSLLQYPRPNHYEGERAYGIADCDVPN